MRLVQNTLLTTFVLCAIILSAFSANANQSEQSTADKMRIGDIYDDLEIFATTLTVVDDHYVDKTIPRDLIRGALRGLLASLDPYSQFLDPASHQDIKVETEGKFGGIGVEISIHEGILTVISPIDGTPASQVGLRPGDRIVKIDELSTRGLSLDDAVDLLRGKPNSTVSLVIMRDIENQILELEIVRTIIKVQSIERSVLLAPGIGYVRIAEFQQGTPTDFARVMAELERQGLDGLILDLRNNPGGLLPEAIKVAEQLVPKGLLIVSTRGRTPDQNLQFVSSGHLQKRPYPIVILVNKGTASASEILAGALQDHRLAVVLGTKTFGKGSVQTVIPMRDGSALRLTTSKYFTPRDQQIHGIGLTPDVIVEYRNLKLDVHPKDDDEAGLSNNGFNRLGQGVKAETEETENNKLKLMQNDNQIQRALDLIRGLKVYSKKLSNN